MVYYNTVCWFYPYKIGRVEKGRWKRGRGEGWKRGRMEGWKDGRVEKDGREGWKDGRVEGWLVLSPIN